MNPRRQPLRLVRCLAPAFLSAAVGWAAWLSWLPAEEIPPGTGSLRGRIALGVPGVSLADLGPVVLHLDGADGPLKFEPPAEVPRIHQKDARFNPSFLVIAAGQTVELPNDDKIVHNVFSFSKPNEFDLGLYPKGSSKSVTLKHPGVVDLFCSIHANMTAAIFVAASPYHAVADAAGVFEIRGIPPGKYRLRGWCRKLAESSQTIEVGAGKSVEATVEMGARK